MSDENTQPPASVKLAIAADVVDAVDPRRSFDERYEALDRATAADQGVAMAVSVELMHALLQSHRSQFGDEALNEIIQQIRAMVGHLFVDE